jgi:hypothetical protein
MWGRLSRPPWGPGPNGVSWRAFASTGPPASQMAYRAGQAQQSSVERRAEQGIDALLRRHRL